MTNLYKVTFSLHNLEKAWRVVCNNGLQSKSNETVKLIKEYSSSYGKNLRSLQRKLSRHIFEFPAAIGIPIKRPGKAPRPIVSAPIDSRIVQRAILDAITNVININSIAFSRTSFGGIRNRGVQQAILYLTTMIDKGFKFYFQSDIKNFFTSIDKTYALKKIYGVLPDNSLNNILEKSVQFELSNASKLRDDIKYFPDEEMGVAQGCCLSPLFGDILLHDVDEELNDGRCVYIRYIDDFILLARTNKDLHIYMKKILQRMKSYNLDLYTLEEKKTKAKLGTSNKGIDFLGCDIYEGYVLPNKKSRQRIVDKIYDATNDSVCLFHSPSDMANKNKSYIETMSYVSNITKGWGNSYSFCNANNIFKQIDQRIDKILKDYAKRFNTAYKSYNPIECRLALGVHPLMMSKSRPIKKQSV